MAETVKSWIARSAWQGIVKPGHFGADGKTDLRIEVLDGVDLTLIAAPDNTGRELVPLFRERLGMELPVAGRASRGKDHHLLWSGPGKWLLRSASGPDAERLRQELSRLAAVTDQSDGRVVLRLSGIAVRAVLAKGVMADLDPSAFPPLATLITPVAHIRVQIWRLDEGNGPPVFEILAPRSMAGSFWSWLHASAAEFGMDVTMSRG